MQMVKIRIPDEADCTKGFGAMVRRFQVDCYRDNTFVVPHEALQLLTDLGVAYEELGRGGIDYAQKALRDSVASPVQ